MATPQDAELVLKLYELRTEPVLREARKFVATFNPASFDELAALQRDAASQNNAYWRQALSYWDMAAALVNHGALDADLFADTCIESLFYFAKFAAYHAQYQETFGRPFMPSVGTLVEKSPVVAERYAMFLKRFAPKS